MFQVGNTEQEGKQILNQELITLVVELGAVHGEKIQKHQAVRSYPVIFSLLQCPQSYNCHLCVISLKIVIKIEMLSEGENVLSHW